MRDVLGRLLAACLLLCAVPANSQTEPYTIDTVLRLEAFGRAAFDPTGRLAVFERYRPYETGNGFDNGYYARFTRSELMLSRSGDDAPARRLLSDDEGIGHVLGAWSPSGARLLIFQFTGRRWRAGIYTVATKAVAWLRITPELPLYGPIAAWRTDDELVLIARADGDLPWHLRMNWEPNIILSRLTAQQAEGQPSVIAIGGGASRDVVPSRALGKLVSVDARTVRVRPLAEGRFQDLELSPNGRYAAVADEGDVLPVDPERPMVQGELQRSRSLRIVDLDDATVWDPAPGYDLLPNLLTWSDRNELLVWMRTRGGGWSKGTLKRFLPGSRSIADVEMGGAAPMFGETSERLPVVRAAWLGDRPVLLSSTSDTRADWRLLTDAGAVNLTSGLGTVPDHALEIVDDAMVLVAAGVVWRIDDRGQATALSGSGQTLTEVRDEGRMFGLRPWFNPQPLHDWAVVQNETGGVFRVDARGLTPITGNARSVAAISSRSVLQIAKTDAGVETLQKVINGTATDLATINAALAHTRVADALAISHVGPNGQALTSWLYTPADASMTGPPPLVVIPYPGQTFAARPAMAEPQALMTAFNVQVLVGAGYAVLLPSLPRRSEDGAADGLGAQIERVIDAAAQTRRFDPARVALWGHSFGAFGALAAATQSHRFAGVIGSNGAYDFASHWGTFTPFNRLSPSDLLSIYSNVGSVETGQGGMGAPPWAAPARYVGNSPFFSADKITAPILLIASDLDYVPLTGAEMLFSALYRQNKDVMLLTYIGEGHVLTGPGNLRDMYGRLLPWLQRIFAAPISDTDTGRIPAPSPGLRHDEEHDVAVAAFPDQGVGRQGGFERGSIQQAVPGEKTVQEERSQSLEVMGDGLPEILRESALGSPEPDGVGNASGEGAAGQASVTPAFDQIDRRNCERLLQHGLGQQGVKHRGDVGLQRRPMQAEIAGDGGDLDPFCGRHALQSGQPGVNPL